MDVRNRILFLLDKFVINQCTQAETDELFGYLGSPAYDELLKEHIATSLENGAEGLNLPLDRSETLVNNIMNGSNGSQFILKSIHKKQRIRRMIAIAAVIILVAVMSVFSVNRFFQRNTDDLVTIPDEHETLTVNHNKTNKALSVALEDGSVVILQPNASLYYPAKFGAQNRSVKLVGDAFFEIAKDPNKPFLVHHDNLVTRVLGTSFYIKHNDNDDLVEVEVRTGRVEVYKPTKKNTEGKGKLDNGVIITPNQKVRYDDRTQLFSTSLVDIPVPISQPSNATTRSYSFDKEKLSVILDIIQKDYGIKIELEQHHVAECLFSGNIDGLSLYTKLDIMVTALGLHYELKGTTILITGKGCL
ncbi:FecR family protein [Terrimonas rubra]|uniref:FecR family protein n=1 Tax=Terrimonas rubra TaxID=1035890 RepID=A0ABW6AAS1_9BACT